MKAFQDRPGRKFKYDYDKLAEKLEKYTTETDIPIIKEFCYKNKINHTQLYNMAKKHEQLNESLRRCSEKKEAQLEKLGLKGEVNASMAKLSLHQLGWRENKGVELTGKDGGPIETKSVSEQIKEYEEMYQQEEEANSNGEGNTEGDNN